jgi:hypothetical protein
MNGRKILHECLKGLRERPVPRIDFSDFRFFPRGLRMASKVTAREALNNGVEIA